MRIYSIIMFDDESGKEVVAHYTKDGQLTFQTHGTSFDLLEKAKKITDNIKPFLK